MGQIRDPKLEVRIVDKKLSDMTVKDAALFMLWVFAGFAIFCGIIMLVAWLAG